MISARDLSKHFGELVAVDRVSFDVEPGDVFGYLGPNGAGKTTTVRMLAGAIRPTSGHASIDGIDVIESPHMVRKICGVLTENTCLYTRLTVRENLEFYAGIYEVPRDKRSRRIAELIEYFGLTEYQNRFAGHLSRGTAKKVAFARALIHDPKVIFLDSPTADLDPIMTEEIWDLIGTLRAEEKVVFITTHNLYEAEKLCNRVCIIQRGKIVAAGTPRELAARVSSGEEIQVQLQEVPTPQLVETVRNLEIAEEVRVQGNTIVILVKDAETATPTIVESVVKGGGKVRSIDTKRGTMWDVYRKAVRS
ncbi:MAG: ABC transporter ATP-binding protein [Candidatus Thorarchaeota archaeon]